jgi:hypothetical protein
MSIIAVATNNVTEIEPMTILVGRLVFQKNTTIIAPRKVRMLQMKSAVGRLNVSATDSRPSHCWDLRSRNVPALLVVK